MIAPSDYIEEAKGRSERNRISSGQIAQVFDAYQTLMKQEHTIDFEDVLLLTTAMLEQEREVRERVHDQYRYFTVDEYQDISPLQQRLINAWLETAKRFALWAIQRKQFIHLRGQHQFSLTVLQSDSLRRK